MVTSGISRIFESDTVIMYNNNIMCLCPDSNSKFRHNSDVLAIADPSNLNIFDVMRNETNRHHRQYTYVRWVYFVICMAISY